ncbi:MAG: TonB-dependent receptor [candidate division KSB1 bacterium]|nr:TonB-dependent receptor [candidate division KSB1 bacterium]MDZ7276126.1 TonB-dependent receptor [candidate division KSB1 bacterium]MDZ7287094.1 TonB-dependent receptor [candidate division KSB1 bacterium]MDZ7296981.1 TonB-dependent receptor [candidate division KSB1 bacterium]MDZ7347848.1 TonB-dependent receptor [candidate division KSB1 bacterium]
MWKTGWWPQRLLLAVIVLLGWTPVLHGQHFGEIRGRVVDAETGEVLPGATVQILESLLGAGADASGTFVIRRVPPGNHALRASLIGYQVAHAEVTVQADAVTGVEFALRSSVLEMNEVVVTASRQPEEIQRAVVSISALSGETALRRDAARLDRALESIPGVSLIEQNVNVRNSSGYNRGLGSRVLILLDGVPALPSDFGTMNWDILPVTDFERVEVIKGPSSALYGSFALGGVINVITRAPMPQGRLSIRTSAGIYDRPYYPEWKWTERTLHFNRQDVSYSRQIGRLGFRFSIGRSESTGDRQNRHYHRWNATGKLVWGFAGNTEITLFGAYARDRRGEFVWSDLSNPYLVPNATGGRPEDFAEFRLKLDAYTLYGQWRQRLNDWLEFKLRTSFVRQLTGNQFRVSGDFEPAQGPGADFQIHSQLDSTVSFTLGVEYKYDFAEQRQIGRHFAYTVSPYFQQDWQPASNWKINLGLRFDQYYLLPGPQRYIKTVFNPLKNRFERIDLPNPLPQGLEEQHLSPQLGMSCALTPATVFHASFGRGIRIPVLGERFLQFNIPIPFRPNAEIATERSLSLEAGVRQRLGDFAHFEVTAFANHYSDLIEPVFVPEGANFYAILVNIPKAKVEGIEAASRLRFWQNRLGLEASATWTNPVITAVDKDAKIPVPFQEGDLLSYRPRVTAYLSPALTLGGWALEADYSFASRLLREQVQIFKDDQRVPKRQLDMRLLYSWNQFTAHLAVRNLLRYNYYQVERNINEVRNFSAGVRWEY